MHVVCISAKAQHGKDTTASMLKLALEERGKKALIFHYADLLKHICKEYFQWDGVKDESGRSLLQHIGTDVIRAKDSNYWVDFAVKFLQMFEDTWDYVLIPDCRFPNEIDVMKDNFKTSHLRIFRPNFKSPLSIEQQGHASEVALDNYPFDYCIYNSTTILDLGISVMEFADTTLLK